MTLIARFALVAVIGLALSALVGCSSSPKNATAQAPNAAPAPPPATTSSAVRPDVLAASDFKRQGIRIVYSTTGEIDSIETTGYAPVWGRSTSSVREAFRVAELEAKKSLNDFINQEVITTETSVRMFSRNLERARTQQENTTAINNNRDVVASLDSNESLEDDGGSASENWNRNQREAMTIATTVNTTIRVRNQGILAGLYLVEGEVVGEGRQVRVVYRWDRKHTAGRTQVRQLMMQ